MIELPCCRSRASLPILLKAIVYSLLLEDFSSVGHLDSASLIRVVCCFDLLLVEMGGLIVEISEFTRLVVSVWVGRESGSRKLDSSDCLRMRRFSRLSSQAGSALICFHLQNGGRGFPL